MKQSVHKWTEIGDLMIGYSTNGTIPEETWQKFLVELKTRPITRLLWVSIGALEVPSLRRKQVAEALAGKGVSLAVVTNDRMMRGVVTATSWLGIDVRAFSWVELRDALRRLDVAQAEEERAVEAVMRLKTQCEGEPRSAR